jgi:ABC-type glycerol-3-phosphate transport system substrate-binding protein
MHFEIYMGGEPAWTEDGQPVTFDSKPEAEAALTEYLEEIAEAVANGDMIGYDEDEFEIVEFWN